MPVSELSKSLAFASYLTPVGWMVAMSVRWFCADRSAFATFHLRQGLGLSIVETLLYAVVYRVLDMWVLWNVVMVFLLISILIGLRGVSKEMMRYQPLLGRLYDRAFLFIAER